RAKAVTIGGGASAVIAFVFATRGGLNFLDTVDYFINQFGVAVLGLVEVVLIAWLLRKLKTFKDHANEISDIQVGSWWTISLGLITPIVLGYMLFDLLRTNLIGLFDTDNGNYEGYPSTLIFYGGWLVALGVILIGILLAFTNWKSKPEDGDYDDR